MGKKEKKSEKPEDSLYGSSVQPSTFELEDGRTLQLGDVVRQAYEDSDAESVEDWNTLSDEAREVAIQAVVDTLALKSAAKNAPEKKAPEVKKPVEKAPDLTGLVKMKKDGNTMHAHPDVVKHHEGNGWKVA